ncbi:MAG: hypothetical protein BWY96_03198 [Spirochaetes bacterium ADurb.BinA120]|nr:MAG: hypothetical protein BWY96_03198 [Spirochaetes bacterium ADurb.BinA120]
MITFICRRDDYPIAALVDFSGRAGVRVIVRGYAIIESGEVAYYA